MDRSAHRLFAGPRVGVPPACGLCLREADDQGRRSCRAFPSLTVAAPPSFNLSPVAASSEPGACRTENKVEKGLGWCQRGVGFAFLGPHNPCRMGTYASSSLAATPSSQSRAAGPARDRGQAGGRARLPQCLPSSCSLHRGCFELQLLFTHLFSLQSCKFPRTRCHLPFLSKA